MKIQSLEINNYAPIKNLKIENMGSVVIVAGANGAGKTRLKQAIVQTFQGSSQMNLKIKATRDEEKKDFKNDFIEVRQGQTNDILNRYMNGRSFGKGKYIGSLVQIDSKRNIESTRYNPVSWQVLDPDDQETPSSFYWQNFMNYIYQKVAAHQGKIAEEVHKNPQLKGEEILSKHPHPLEKYKDIFKQLLPEKELQDINPVSPEEFRYKDIGGSILPFNSLSSGEQEVRKLPLKVDM